MVYIDIGFYKLCMKLTIHSIKISEVFPSAGQIAPTPSRINSAGIRLVFRALIITMFILKKIITE